MKIEGWISIEDEFPPMGKIVQLLYDRQLGDYWDRYFANKRGNGRFSVYSGFLFGVNEYDGEISPRFCNFQLASGSPCREYHCITHWKHLDSPPDIDYDD